MTLVIGRNMQVYLLEGPRPCRFDHTPSPPVTLYQPAPKPQTNRRRRRVLARKQRLGKLTEGA